MLFRSSCNSYAHPAKLGCPKPVEKTAVEFENMDKHSFAFANYMGETEYNTGKLISYSRKHALFFSFIKFSSLILFIENS